MHELDSSANRVKVLVTGATGFIGRTLLGKLQAHGWETAALVRPATENSEPRVFDNTKVFDYEGNYESVRRAVREFQPDVVVHLASLFLARHVPADIPALVSSNLLFGTLLLEAMAEAGGGRFVNTGTSWQHYDSDSYRPVNLYAATKQGFQDILDYYVDARGIKAITLKLSDTYGYGDVRPKLLQLLLRTWETGEVLKMSPGEQEIEYTHVDDVAKGFLGAAELLLGDTFCGSASYSLRSGAPVTVKELVKLIESLSGRRLNVEFGATEYRPREMMTAWKGEMLPKWKAEISLEKGLKEMLDKSGYGCES
jgi:nucleoside-diphosphate-sugar epimerase